MSEQLENTVGEMLKTETWTRAGIASFTQNDLDELKKTLEECRKDGCEWVVKEICDEQLSHTKDSITALYLSGMIATRTGSVDTASLHSLIDIFEKNHKEALVEQLCLEILQEEPQNRLALRKLAERYKAENDDRVWDLYEKIVKADYGEAEMARLLAERFDSQGNKELAISYWRKALHRFVNQRNAGAVKSVWSALVQRIPEDIDFFMSVQRKIAKTMGAEKSLSPLQDLYGYYKNTAKWDTAINLLKMILEIDGKDSWARRELADCYRAKYSDRPHVEDYIKSSNLTQNFRNIFESISDFEKHISFDAKNYVYHRTWGVGMITKVQGDTLTINFGKKSGMREMSLEMAKNALQPLARDHIWVYKKTVKKEELAKKVKADVAWTLKTVIKSFGNKCSEKQIKAEIVPSILTVGEWTSWHNKAQKILDEDPTFGVDPDNINLLTVRDKEASKLERLSNEFKADKSFFPRVDIIMRYMAEEIEDPSDEKFTEMIDYFSGFLKSSYSQVNEQTVASYMVLQEVAEKFGEIENPAKFTFDELYGQLEDPRKTYSLLKDTKTTHLKVRFLGNIRKFVSGWQDEFIRLFPTVLNKEMLDQVAAAGAEDKVIKLVQECFDEYRSNRNAVVYLAGSCKGEEWFAKSGIAQEKILATLVNVVSLCGREIANHINTVENKKTAKAATQLLFGKEKSTANPMLEYLTNCDSQNAVSRMYTMVSDVKDIDSAKKAALRRAIVEKYPDFKFQEQEVRQEEVQKFIVTARMLAEKKAEVEDIEKNQLPKIAAEISEAREKGDLKENAEYHAAREAQQRTNKVLERLRSEIGRATIFDPTAASSSYVGFGTKTVFRNNLDGSEVTYKILGAWESDVAAGIISYLSPLGSKLLGMKEGDRREFSIHERPYDLTALSIVLDEKAQ